MNLEKSNCLMVKSNNIDKIMNKFKELCCVAQDKWSETPDTQGYEPALLTILDYVKKNIQYRSVFVKGFIELVYDRTKGPYEIIIFCMRELQWEEVKLAVRNRMSENDDPRVLSVMQFILDVYNEDWSDADLYYYYSNQIKFKNN